MLDTYIIKKIIDEENEKRKYSQQPQIPIPYEIEHLPKPVDKNPSPPEIERGVIIIEM
jgi:hypothetical protein|tara:strand:- start:696 stop:869 length:174 start_codon:yes stop_codon:yes gene_type:complete